MIIESTTIVFIYFTFLILAAKRLLTYLHVLQQEDYNGARLMGWIGKYKAFDKRLTTLLVVLTVANFYVPPFVMGFLVFLGFCVTIYLEKDPRKSVKKKLVMTARARRIFIPAFVIQALLGCWMFALPSPFGVTPWPWIFVLQSIPFTLLFAHSMMQPIEQIVQRVYWNEAKDKLNRLKPTIIAVTGSFGKTSVKHILGHILNTQAATLITPGSVNTVMGITRIIREQLTENHKYFVVEMGAYGPGSIAELCKLCPPDVGIITAIGHAHYERFRSLKTVAEAKFELAQAVLKKETGKVIVHERTLKYPNALVLRVEHNAQFVVVGDAPAVAAKISDEPSYIEPDDIHINAVQQHSYGLEVKLGFDKKNYTVEPPLYGLHHGHNTALAAAAAMAVGVDIGMVQLAMQTLPQIPHRLEVKKKPAEGYTLIDDAYNSNPIGFRSALDLMTLIGGGRKILITPGMIELGIAHNEVHAKLGEYAGQVCDVAIIVNSKRIPTFIDGFKRSGSGKTLLEVGSFHDASEWISANKQEGDMILIENDLPDMYEYIPKM
jgi:UDP-N-acetylmuramoyl-tripeptide--D-alanyl-D-alanine ligase